MEFDQKGLILQHTFPCGSFPPSWYQFLEHIIEKEINKRYDVIIWTFQPMIFLAHLLIYIYMCVCVCVCVCVFKKQEI